MKLLRTFFLACTVPMALSASERAEVKMTCPLDGTEFTAVQDFSGTATGMRLDLKKMGAINQPWALARCPECGIPLFRKQFTDDEVRRLKEIVASERFRTEARSATAWFALGVVQEELKTEPFEIGRTYLSASWEMEDERGFEAYGRAARRAIIWFDRAATELKEQPDRRKDLDLARYLPVELCRRIGDFELAQSRLLQLPDMSGSGIAWLPAALQTQARLIAAKDKSPHDDGEEPLMK